MSLQNIKDRFLNDARGKVLATVVTLPALGVAFGANAADEAQVRAATAENCDAAVWYGNNVDTELLGYAIEGSNIKVFSGNPTGDSQVSLCGGLNPTVIDDFTGTEAIAEAEADVAGVRRLFARNDQVGLHAVEMKYPGANLRSRVTTETAALSADDGLLAYKP